MKAENGIFFYCRPYETPDKAAYQHAVVALAEGLTELGIPCYADRPYWKLSPTTDEHLLKPAPGLDPRRCAAIVMNDRWFSYGGAVPAELGTRDRACRLVYLDCEDGICTRSWDAPFRAFDLILKSHFNRKVRYPSNVRPWAFGLTRRIVEATRDQPPFAERKAEILCNFRHGHYLRRLTNRTFLPRIAERLAVNATVDDFSQQPADAAERLLWAQTGRRHYPRYYRRLTASAACSCFGGCFVAPFPRNPSTWLARRVNQTIQERGVRTRTVVQYDSFRLWEAWAAGCVVFHVDFERYGFRLPVMPLNGEHYMGIDVGDPAAAAAAALANSAGWGRIAAAGRAWALAHYAPQPVAQRFLQMLGLSVS